VLDYEAGLAAYRNRDFAAALQRFESVDSARLGGDPPSRIFIDRCQTLVADPPAADWNYIAVQMEK
jgi:adenylate cyclase